MDFYTIRTKETKGAPQAYPDWIVGDSEDLMTRGGAFYAIWNEKTGLWSTDEMDVQRIVDEDLVAYVQQAEAEGTVIDPLLTRNFSTGSWERFNRYIRNLPEKSGYRQLDSQVTFANTPVEKKDYVSKRLPYSIEKGRTDAWDELLNVLYSPDERAKIEWSIGAIVSGDSTWIQKFLVFYGPPASGKSTVIGIIEKMFAGYVAAFEAKALTSNNGSFAMEPFEHNPLVAIQHDGDLSRIEDNSRLNSLVGHELMSMNVKFRSAFAIRPNAFLIIGTNKPVKITDAKAGNTRRLIDVHPTGAKIVPARYHVLIENINFELGAIAYRCLEQYHQMGKYYYDGYIPTRMMMLTNSFYNFVETHFDIFKREDALQLKQIWEMYKQYCEDFNVYKRLQYHELRDEVATYFHEFHDRYPVHDKELRSVYVGFKGLPGQSPAAFVPDTSYVIELRDVEDPNESAFNLAYSAETAQYARPGGAPARKWEKVETVLHDIDTSKLHYVKVPENHIVIDFDLVDEDGEKSLELNIEAASQLPPTYTEVSRSGKGVHLHYIYGGSVHELNSVYDVGVEIKTLLGDSALRRQLTKCNNLDISTISGGLPLKEKPVIDKKSIQSERKLRELIDRNLRKEIHPGTKPSIDFIHHILQEAYDNGLSYNVEDLRPVLLTFAARSTNQAVICIKTVQDMKFVGQRDMKLAEEDESPLVFFDVEVYPNLFVVCWKKERDDQVIKMINPKPADVEGLFQMKLIGFNNRRYDNHILYAAYLGHNNEQLFDLSQKLIESDGHNHMFGEAYNLSYADIYDFSSKKQGLKKFQIELGIFHMELDLPWDEPVDRKLWDKVVEYCSNDVISTEEVFHARKQDFIARRILAEVSGLTVNHTTQQHTARIIFGTERNPQRAFVYTDLSHQFPGYRFDGGKSTYHEESPGEGGYVYAEPGVYKEVAVLDVASMHPTSITELNLFGDYTKRFSDLVEARLAIKRKDYESARLLLEGKLSPFLDGDLDDTQDLAYALKIVINTVYGLTSARFPNPFKDNRNIDNIVAKRGALFMIDLKHAVQDEGFQVVHIKTDSIKIPGATSEIIDFVTKFGEKYGYEFEHETTYDKFCLVNDAVYVARSHVCGDHETTDCRAVWTAVGAQFQHPYVFKQLFSQEPVEFDDLCETKSVQKGRIYLDMTGTGRIEEMKHVGRTGSFMPVRYDGGVLWRINEEKQYHVTGTKGYSWIERDLAQFREERGELFTDMDYFEKLKNDAIAAIEQFIPYEEFVS